MREEKRAYQGTPDRRRKRELGAKQRLVRTDSKRVCPPALPGRPPQAEAAGCIFGG